MTIEGSLDNPAFVTLKDIAGTYALRFDAKHHMPAAIKQEQKVRGEEFVQLGTYLPSPFVKGVQHEYLDMPLEDSVPVINTASIQRLSILLESARYISREDYDALNDDRKLRRNDVVLTVDGGASIGKPAIVAGEGPGAVDSHVLILRPVGIEPLTLMYLLASPMAQNQFDRYESGASGQTAVTEDDIRRFIFPLQFVRSVAEAVPEIEAKRHRIEAERERLLSEEESIWSMLG